jgi:DNA repair exonuclease SbcCD ATPase subunit
LEESFSAAPPKVNITVTQTKQVIPVEDRNVATALKAEIERLRSENGQLCSKITRLEAEVITSIMILYIQRISIKLCEYYHVGYINQVSSRVERDNNGISSNADLLKKLEQDLIAAQAEIRRLQENDRSPQHSLETSNTEQLQSVQEAMQKLSEELVSSKMSACEQTEKLRQDLEARESKLRQVQSNLLLAEKELDKKFQATSAYANMKKILLQKNNKIKNLRTKLEALGGADGGEDEEEDGDGSKVGFHV